MFEINVSYHTVDRKTLRCLPQQQAPGLPKNTLDMYIKS